MTIANGLAETADVEELIARIVRKKFPALALLSVRTYTVRKVYAGADYGRCDLALESDPEEQLPRVDQWPGIAGGVCLPVVGSLAEVAWRDGDQRSPVIVGFQPLRATGGKPTEVKIDASVVRIGPTADMVRLAGGGEYVALANLVDARFSALVLIINQIAALLNVAGPVIGAPLTVTPFTAATVAATRVSAQ